MAIITKLFAYLHNTNFAGASRDLLLLMLSKPQIC